jgi:predicted TIM-barrel fold metal-dependent hydrolase
MPPIIDFHVHVFPDFLAAAAMSEVTPGGIAPCFDGTLSGLRALLRQNAINLAVVQPVATKPEQVHSINRWHAKLQDWPEVKAFGALHPAMPLEAAETEIVFLREHGIRGVKMHPEYQEFNPDEDRLAPFYSLLEKHRMILLLHAGVDFKFADSVRATPQRIAQVLKGFPQLTLVAAHLGGYQLWDEVGKHLAGKNLYLDTGFCLHEPATPQLLELIRAHGTQRVLFASDAPWGNQTQQIRNLQKMPLAPQEIQDIAGNNAYNLLGLNAAATK